MPLNPSHHIAPHHTALGEKSLSVQPSTTNKEDERISRQVVRPSPIRFVALADKQTTASKTFSQLMHGTRTSISISMSVSLPRAEFPADHPGCALVEDNAMRETLSAGEDVAKQGRNTRLRREVTTESPHRLSVLLHFSPRGLFQAGYSDQTTRHDIS